MDDDTYELYDRIWYKVHALVDRMTKDLDPDEDYELRQKLTEEFRFWRRNAA
ncbi:MAG: hypothetical protein VW239_01525 [Candidatus Nanopelagicales bacterium]